jgi:predicted Zn finger-like uncharacterized protein
MARATTTCPSCGTTFRVKPDQLAARHGQVRCGHCRLIFNGFATLSVGADTATGKGGSRPEPVEAGGPPAEARHHRTTLRVGDAARRLRIDTPARRGEPAHDAPEPDDIRDDASAVPAAAGERAAPELMPLDLTTPPSALGGTLRVVGIVGGVALAALVLAVSFREQTVRAVPGLAEPLRAVCEVLGCSIPLAQDADSMSIETSELKIDPDHPKMLVVTASLRNRARFPQAYPALELTLTDARDAVLSKRRILPEEYLSRGNAATAGIAPNAEVSVRLPVGADDGRAAGYRLYLYYP